MSMQLRPTSIYASALTDMIDTPAFQAYTFNPNAGNLNGALNYYTQDCAVTDTGVYRVIAGANPNRCGSGYYSVHCVAEIRMWNAWHQHYTPYILVEKKSGDLGNFDFCIYYSANNNEYTSYIPTPDIMAATGGNQPAYWENSNVYLRVKVYGCNYACSPNTPDPRPIYMQRIADCP
jgi:hypothetical protein